MALMVTVSARHDQLVKTNAVLVKISKHALQMFMNSMQQSVRDYLELASHTLDTIHSCHQLCDSSTESTSLAVLFLHMKLFFYKNSTVCATLLLAIVLSVVVVWSAYSVTPGDLSTSGAEQNLI